MSFEHDVRGKQIPDKEGKANALRIVTCVNGYSKLENDLAFAMDLSHRENKMVEKLKGDNAALVSALQKCIVGIIGMMPANVAIDNPIHMTAYEAYHEAKALINTIEGNK